MEKEKEQSSKEKPSKVQEKLAKQQALIDKVGEEYLSRLDDEMGRLHNQFVAFISATKVPLPHVVMVLQILLRETTDEAMRRYLGVE